MIKRNQNVINIANITTDCALNILSAYIAYMLRFFVFDAGTIYQTYDLYFYFSLLGAVFCGIFWATFGLYRSKRKTNFWRNVFIVLEGNAIGTLLIGLLLYVWRLEDFSRLMLVYYFVVSVLLVAAKHTAADAVLRAFRAKGKNAKHILIIGSGQLAAEYYEAVCRAPWLGYKVSGVVKSGEASQSVFGEELYKGGVEKLERILAETYIDEAVIALDEDEIGCTEQVINVCNLKGIRFSIIPYFSKYYFSHAAPAIQMVGSSHLYDIFWSPLDNIFNRTVKRATDIAASIVLLCLFSPIMLITTAVVCATSKGPVLFRQERVGRSQKTFTMYKFRSMRVNDQQTTAWSKKGDARITEVGRFIRKTGLDELPQLFNILKGDMSLVGPRPELPFHVNNFKSEIPYYMTRHQIRPGLTGWAQINGYRGDTSIEERVRHDLFYTYNWSFFLDCRIILKTVFGGMADRQ